MGERTSYERGTFCAVDLSSPDREASQAFYTGLFGWEVPKQPPEHDFFTAFFLGGRMVAGAIDHRGDGPPARGAGADRRPHGPARGVLRALRGSRRPVGLRGVISPSRG